MAITNQVKPEELAKKIEALDAPEPEKDENEAVHEADEEKTPEENEETPEVDNDQEKTEDEAEEESEPVTKAKKEAEEADETDWKARYAGSTREAQVLAAKNKQMVESVEQASKMEMPTDAEMIKIYGDNWEVMDEVQKKLAVQTELSTRRFNVVSKTVEETKKIDEWLVKVNEFAQDPQTVTRYPQLQGREVEFTQFASIPSRVGVGLEDLVRAFSFDLKAPQPKRKSLFESGGGGSVPKPKTLTVEEIKFIRETNFRQYERLKKAGKIKIEI